jgi:hemin uptake protein HemP
MSIQEQSNFKTNKVKSSKSILKDSIDEKKIIIDGNGQFPKIIIIMENGKTREYELIKTQNGKYLLN